MLTPEERRALALLVLLLSLGAALRAVETNAPRILTLTLGDSLALGAGPEDQDGVDSVLERPHAIPEPTPPNEASTRDTPNDSIPNGTRDLKGRLDLNRATAEELETLPGVGPKTAQRIVEDREKKGPFRRPRDLTRVRGIGPKTLERLLPHIRVRTERDSTETRLRS